MGMPSLVASSLRSLPTWPMAASARLSLSFLLAATFLPGAATVPRAEAFMLMWRRLSTATILGWASSRISRIWPAHLLVASLGVTSCSFSIFGDGVSASLAVTRLARDVSLMLAFSVATPCAASVVCAVSGADGQVILRAPVCAENVLRFLDVQLFEGHRFRYGDLDVQAVVPAVKWRAQAVCLHGNEPD